MRAPTLQDRFEYILVRLLEGMITLLPARAADRMGAVIGDILRRLGIRRTMVLRNLQRAFPDADPTWIETTARECYRHLGREAVAMVRLSRMRPEQIVALTETDSWPVVEEALAEGKGVLVVTGHYGNWEVAAAAVAARGVPIQAIVKSQRNGLVNSLVEEARARLGIGTIEMGKAPRLVPRVLRDGGVVGIVGDQDARWKGVWVPFFGRPASTFRGPAQFALRLGAPVIASIARRRPDGRYHLEGSRLEVERTGDLEEDELRLTAAIAAHLEAEIRKDPAQYFWFHNRWKTIPPAELPNRKSV